MKSLILVAFSILSIQSAFCQRCGGVHIPTAADSIKVLTQHFENMPRIQDPILSNQTDIPIQPFTISSEETAQLGGLNFTRFQFNNNINLMANMMAGVYAPYGQTPSIMGAQANGTAYYIDGVRVFEGVLPQSIP
jgi:hypothetical protein